LLARRRRLAARKVVLLTLDSPVRGLSVMLLVFLG
jgi:hypothetical protein